jgi:hypothetical protein
VRVDVGDRLPVQGCQPHQRGSFLRRAVQVKAVQVHSVSSSAECAHRPPQADAGTTNQLMRPAYCAACARPANHSAPAPHWFYHAMHATVTSTLGKTGSRSRERMENSGDAHAGARVGNSPRHDHLHAARSNRPRSRSTTANTSSACSCAGAPCRLGRLKAADCKALKVPAVGGKGLPGITRSGHEICNQG